MVGPATTSVLCCLKESRMKNPLVGFRACRKMGFDLDNQVRRKSLLDPMALSPAKGFFIFGNEEVLCAKHET